MRMLSLRGEVEEEAKLTMAVIARKSDEVTDETIPTRMVITRKEPEVTDEAIQRDDNTFTVRQY